MSNVEEDDLPQNTQSFQVQTINGSPRVRWGLSGSAYCLLRLAREGAPLKLPPERVEIDHSTVSGWNSALAIAEPSGGGRDFLHWTTETLQALGEPWVRVDGTQWQRGLFSWSKNAEDGLKESFGACLEELPTRQAAEGAEALIRWTKSTNVSPERKLNVLIRDLGRLPSESAKECAQSLRISMDKNHRERTLSRLRFIIVDTSEKNFEDTYLTSGLATLCDQFRLPWLNQSEAVDICRSLIGESGTFDSNSADELMVITGGQPLLVHQIAQVLEGFESPSPGGIEIGTLRRAFRKLRNSPPPAESRWRRDFANRCREKPAVLSSLREFSAGNSLHKDASLSLPERQLFFSGWIRFDPRTLRWKISSKLHAAYARKIADELEES